MHRHTNFKPGTLTRVVGKWIGQRIDEKMSFGVDLRTFYNSHKFRDYKVDRILSTEQISTFCGNLDELISNTNDTYIQKKRMVEWRTNMRDRELCKCINAMRIVELRNILYDMVDSGGNWFKEGRNVVEHDRKFLIREIDRLENLLPPDVKDMASTFINVNVGSKHMGMSMYWNSTYDIEMSNIIKELYDSHLCKISL